MHGQAPDCFPGRTFFFGAGINPTAAESSGVRSCRSEEIDVTDSKDNPGASRRTVLECMAWAGTGLVWTLAGGVPVSRLIGTAEAATEDAAGTTGFSFVQISDSHIGFSKPANPDARATLKLAVDQIASFPEKPAFLIHTGDISHLSRANEFDDASQ